MGAWALRSGAAAGLAARRLARVMTQAGGGRSLLITCCLQGVNNWRECVSPQMGWIYGCSDMEQTEAGTRAARSPGAFCSQSLPKCPTLGQARWPPTPVSGGGPQLSTAGSQEPGATLRRGQGSWSVTRSPAPFCRLACASFCNKHATKLLSQGSESHRNTGIKAHLALSTTALVIPEAADSISSRGAVPRSSPTKAPLRSSADGPGCPRGCVCHKYSCGEEDKETEVQVQAMLCGAQTPWISEMPCRRLLPGTRPGRRPERQELGGAGWG